MTNDDDTGEICCTGSSLSHPDRSAGFGSKRGKNDPEKLKKVKKFYVLKCCSLCGLKAFPVAWTSFMDA